MCEARSWDYCFMLVRNSVSLSFTFLKLFLHTQSVVRVLYLVHVLYSVRSPHVSPNPCFIPFPQSAVGVLY